MRKFEAVLICIGLVSLGGCTQREVALAAGVGGAVLGAAFANNYQVARRPQQPQQRPMYVQQQQPMYVGGGPQQQWNTGGNAECLPGADVCIPANRRGVVAYQAPGYYTGPGYVGGGVQQQSFGAQQHGSWQTQETWSEHQEWEEIR